MSSSTALAPSATHPSATPRSVWAIVSLFERAASALLLILLAPVLLVVAIAIVALSRRSPLVSHLRVGQFGAPLWTWKFRTMWPEKRTGVFALNLMDCIVDESGINYKS